MTEEKEKEDVYLVHVTDVVKGISCKRKTALKLSGEKGTFSPMAETLIGTATHKVMEKYVKKWGLEPGNPLEIDPDVINPVLDIVGEEFRGAVEERVKALGETLVAGFARLPSDILPTPGVTELIPEYNFAFDTAYSINGKEIWLTGTADLVIMTEGYITVIDYKTGSGKRSNKAHDAQVRFYSAYLAASLNKSCTEGYLIYGGDDAPIVKTVSKKGDLPDHEAYIQEVLAIAGTDPKSHQCSVGYMCRYCQYFGGQCKGI